MKMKIIHSEMHKRRVPIIHIKAKSLHHFTFQTNYDKIVETMYNYMLATTISVYFTLFGVSSLARKTSLLSRSDNTLDVLYVVLILFPMQHRNAKWYVLKHNSSIAKTILTWKWKGKHINKGQYSIICLNVNHLFILASTMYTNDLKINIDH